MRYETWVNYLEYIELNEAREFSRDAHTMATVAIMISAAMALIQILIALGHLLLGAQRNQLGQL